MNKKTLWQIELFDNGAWRRYGSPSSNYRFAYYGMTKLAECGHKVRLRKVIE